MSNANTHTTNLQTAKNNLDKAQAEYTTSILQARQNGMSLRAIATILQINHNTVANILKANQ
jgi:DNA-binding CsgD family transcriptional regulator